MFIIIQSIDQFIEGGNPYRLTSVILLIDLGKPYHLAVGSRTSLMDMVAIFIFM